MRKMGRRASLELSAQMIVILIISIAILGMGLILVRKIYTSAEKQVGDIDQRTKDILFDQLDRGERVVNPFNRQEVVRKKLGRFGIALRNKLNNPDENGGNYFTLVVTPSLVPEEASIDDVEGWIIAGSEAPYNKKIEYVLNNERQLLVIAIAVPKDAPAGTYAFNLIITYEDPEKPGVFEEYWPTEKLYAVVK